MRVIKACLLTALDELAMLDLPPLMTHLSEMVAAHDALCEIREPGDAWRLANKELQRCVALVVGQAKRRGIGREGEVNRFKEDRDRLTAEVERLTRWSDRAIESMDKATEAIGASCFVEVPMFIARLTAEVERLTRLHEQAASGAADLRAEVGRMARNAIAVGTQRDAARADADRLRRELDDASAAAAEALKALAGEPSLLKNAEAERLDGICRELGREVEQREDNADRLAEALMAYVEQDECAYGTDDNCYLHEETEDAPCLCCRASAALAAHGAGKGER